MYATWLFTLKDYSSCSLCLLLVDGCQLHKQRNVGNVMRSWLLYCESFFFCILPLFNNDSRDAEVSRQNQTKSVKWYCFDDTINVGQSYSVADESILLLAQSLQQNTVFCGIINWDKLAETDLSFFQPTDIRSAVIQDQEYRLILIFVWVCLCHILVFSPVSLSVGTILSLQQL